MEQFQCRICGAGEYSFHCHVKDTTSRNTGLEFNYVRCCSCGTLSLSPMPTPEQTAFANETLLGITRPNSSFDKRYTDAYRESLRNEYRQTFRDLGIDTTPPHSHAKCFDFGCAIGTALDILADAGWETYGLDVSRQLTALADHSRHKIHVGEIDTLPQEWGGFDFVLTIEVLEHLREPAKILRKLVSLLRPGGVLLTETPQVGLLSELYGDTWRVLAGLDHIHLMPQATQFRLLSDCGCRIERWITFGSGCTSGLTPPHIKKAFDQLVKRLGIGDFLAIKSIKVA
jgi:SAM-dependent methyltransferase